MEPPLGQHQEMLMAAPSRNSRLEDMLVCGPKVTPQQEQRNDGNSDKTGNKSQPETSLKCPRCDSTNTKFCYYNNYSLLQPRYFCKSCRRYWTKGGTLRNVPVGGGCRKNNKRLSSSSSSSSSSSTSKRLNPHIDPQFSAIGIEANSIPLINSFPMDTDFSFLGSLGLHSTITNPGATSSSVSIPSFFNSIGNGPFHETRFHDSSFQNSYHKLDNGARQIQGQREEMVAVPKRDITSGSENESRILWGFPWNGNSEDVDFAISGASWNGINSVATNWQGLINSSLM